ncbi:MAG: hypothetical protein JXO22_06405 [Phycisphaerae bacterium]|nr:hypothetical protein [Phycisphaerae bacterium]
MCNRVLWGGVIGAATLLPLTVALAEIAVGGEGVVVVRVEEDWQLVLNEPGEAVMSPQFHTVMSPLCHADTAYAQVSWNYRELFDFAAGGLQLQSWGEDYAFGFADVREDPLSEDAETITWTQSLSTDGARVRFAVTNGQSLTWGTFGGSDTYIDIPISCPSLYAYSPAVSAANSMITFGSNRVTSLKITQVRRYGQNDELLSVDDTPIVIFEMDAELF